MKFFISHSSKDKAIALRMKRFIESIRTDFSVFCSSASGTIGNGEDFVKVIEEQLDCCDKVIVLLSNNYVESNYCMLELGFSYSRLVHVNKTIFNIFTLPGCEGLLNGTPLNHLQNYPVFDCQTWGLFLNEARSTGANVLIGNEDIYSFVQDMTADYLKTTNLFKQSDLIGCCSDPLNPEAIVCKAYADSITVNFNLFKNGAHIKPDFISTVLHFYNDLDLYSLYVANNSIQLHCVIDNYTESIKRIQIELQTENNRGICKPFVIELKEKKTEIAIPISEIAKYIKDLRKLVNICFVVVSDSFIEDEGTFYINDLSIQ